MHRKLQSDCHQKYSTYLQQFHLNIIYKKGSTNHIAECLNQPPLFALSKMLNSRKHETSKWPKLYDIENDFVISYQTLQAGRSLSNFHLQGQLLCHLGHLYVPSSEHDNMIWEAHYSQLIGHFNIEKTVAVLQKYFY